MALNRFYTQLTPAARAEFTILGGYTLLCWLISFVGTFWLVNDATGSLVYAALAPIFLECLAAAGTWLYVAGSNLGLTWLRFLVAPALIFSVAHLLGATTPVDPAWQYAVGSALAVLFVYGQRYVDHALRNTDLQQAASRQYALDLARKRLEEDQAEDMARLQLTINTLGHYQTAANTIRDRLLDAVYPAAEIAPQPAYPSPVLVAPRVGEEHALQVSTETCRADRHAYSCPACAQALTLGQYGAAKRHGYCRHCKKGHSDDA